MQLEAFETLKAELAAFIAEIRDKLESADTALAHAKSQAMDALEDAKNAVAPAMGPGPLAELESAAEAVGSAIGDAEDAIEAARDACYDDFDFDETE